MLAKATGDGLSPEMSVNRGLKCVITVWSEVVPSPRLSSVNQLVGVGEKQHLNLSQCTMNSVECCDLCNT